MDNTAKNNLLSTNHLNKSLLTEKELLLDYAVSDTATLICSLYSAELRGLLDQQHMDLGRTYSVTKHRQRAKVHFPKYPGADITSGQLKSWTTGIH